MPPIAATVPREDPFSKTSTVDPGSAVPVKVNEDAVLVSGEVITGDAGATVSIWITRAAEAGEEPPSVRAFAVNRYAPSAGTVTIRLQVPDSVAVAVPNEVAPSNTSTVAPACALPESVRVRDRDQL